ncbi:hypothetical protein ACQBAR_16495 [Propionibacteriaceae bacterium Y1685]
MKLRNAVAVGLAVALTGLTVACTTGEKSVRQVVETYLDAVVGGRASEAIRLIQSTPDTMSVIPDEALQKAAGLIDGYTIDDVQSGTVEVTLRAGELTDSASLHVDVDTKIITDAYLWRPMTVMTEPAGAAPTINGVTLPEGDSPSRSAVVLTLPGVYDIASRAGPLVEVAPGRSIFKVNDPLVAPSASASVTATLSAEGEAEAQRQFDALLKRCLADRTGHDPACPNQLYDGTNADPDSVRWELGSEIEHTWAEAVDGQFVDQAVSAAPFTVSWTEGGQRRTSRMDWRLGAVVATYESDQSITVSVLGAR